MAEQILQVEGLTARVEDKVILHEVGLTIKKGETHVLMGPNGAGKSTLGYVLTGNPKYSVTEGKILFKGNDITEEAADKRAKAGMFLSFQEPLEVPGLSLESFIRSALSEQGRNKMRVWNFRKELKVAMEVLHMDPSYAGRDLNVGFSGGEKKKSEILQLMMLKPDLAILDETDSGLDVDAVRLASDPRVPEGESGRRTFNHHAQHAHPGRASCGRNPYHGERAYCGIRGCIAGG